MSSHSDHRPDADAPVGVRLQKVLATAGLGSRRECEELILEGRVEIDRQVVTELGTRVDPRRQEIRVDGELLRPPRLTYYALHKPPDVVCTARDPAGRPRAIDLVPPEPRVFAVGRLDMSSEGLLLLTNDGDLAFKLMHPRFGVEKMYHVQVAGRPSREDLGQLLKGVWLSDGRVKARRVQRQRSQGQSAWLKIVLNEGKNREIRRMLAKLGHKVMKLRRIALGPVQLGSLAPGKSRRLTGPELTALRQAAERRGPALQG